MARGLRRTAAAAALVCCCSHAHAFLARPPAAVGAPGLNTAASSARSCSARSNISRRIPRLRMAAAAAATQWAQGQFPGAAVVKSDASTIASALAAAWGAICDVIEDQSQARVVVLPNCETLEDVFTLQKLYNHLEQCQDCCEKFGAEVTLVPHKASPNNPVAFEVKPLKGKAGSREGQDGYEFEADPYWDDDWDIDKSLLGAYSDEDARIAALTSVPESEEEILRISREWNDAIIAGMGICPFAVDADRAGLPIGGIHYPVSKASTAEGVFRDYWEQVAYLVASDVRSVSTTLMITPYFGLENVEAFDILAQALTEPLELLGLEDDVQLVFFHPQHSFRDGQARLSSAGAANFARRSPFPMINILRTPQVRLAQKSIPTGMVYQQNEEVLEAIGADALQRMLEDRSWAELAGRRVDRRGAAVDYYRTAQMLQARTRGMDANVDDVVEEVVSRGVGAPVAEEEVLAAEGGVPVNAAAAAAAVAARARSASPPIIASSMPEVAVVSSESREDGGGAAEQGEEVAVGEEEASQEDIKRVAAVLMKRLMFKRPVSTADFEDMSAAVDRLLAARDVN